MSTKPSPLCEEVSEDIARVLEGTAAPELYEHIEDCDRCRDLRHEVSQALAFVRPAGSDYLAAGDLESRLCSILDQKSPAAKPAAKATPNSVDVRCSSHR